MPSSDFNQISPYFTDQYRDNRVIRDLLKGLKGLRSINQLALASNAKVSGYYLPQFDKEPDHIYTQRVMRSYLTNYFLRTIQSDSGKILASPVGTKQSSGSDLPGDYANWLDDVDLEGMPLNVLARDQLQASQAKGVSLCFVDYLDDERRPFIHQIDIDDVLAFRTSGRTGRLNYLRWKSTVISDSEEELNPTVENTNVVFEVTPTTWALFDEEDLDTPIDSGEIRRFRQGRVQITDEIPVSIFYTNKESILLADSPYRSLAEMTIEHYQVNSDIKNMMFYALQPILFANQVPDDFEVSALASYIMVKVPEGNDSSSLEWVQVDAGSIEQAREQLADIESRISAFGIDANGIRPSGNQTATAKAIDSAGSNAALSAFAQGLQEHLERIIEMMSSYTLQELDVSVTITPDFNISDNNEKAREAREAFTAGLVSGKAATEALKQHGILPEDFDYEQDQEILRDSRAADGMM